MESLRRFRSLPRSLMKPIDAGRATAREALALSRNYRHAANLRRQLRSTHGAAVAIGPTSLVGEALALMEHAPWGRLAILTVLLLIAAVRNR